MELKDLVGMHYLTAVSFELVPTDFNYGDAQVVNFTLDGKTYTAIENPVDGYRSHMDEIKVTDTKLSNSFDPVYVFCIMREGGYYRNEILDVYDTKNGKIVLSVGTKDVDDYYPSFVSDWMPENLAVNQDAN